MKQVRNATCRDPLRVSYRTDQIGGKQLASGGPTTELAQWDRTMRDTLHKVIPLVEHRGSPGIGRRRCAVLKVPSVEAALC